MRSVLRSVQSHVGQFNVPAQVQCDSAIFLAGMPTWQGPARFMSKKLERIERMSLVPTGKVGIMEKA